MKKLKIGEFYEFVVPENRRSDYYKKVCSRLLSLIVRNCVGDYTYEYTKSDYTEKVIRITGNINGCKLHYVFSPLGPNSYFSDYPKSITPYSVEFRGGCVVGGSVSRYNWGKLPKGYEPLMYNNVYDLVRKYPDLQELFPSYEKALKYAMENNKDSWVALGKDQWEYRGLYLCTKPFFSNIKFGEVFSDRDNYHIIYSFDDVYNNRYSTFQKFNVDLSGDIPLPGTILHCSKQKFGCRNYCTHSCLADDVEKKNKQLYSTFIKWKKLLPNTL